MQKITVVNVGYRSTNYWVISAGSTRLLVDLGWPGTMGMLRAQLQRMDMPFEEIHYGLATHYHSDHAGRCRAEMKQWTKPQDNYVEISTHDSVVIPLSWSRSE